MAAAWGIRLIVLAAVLPVITVASNHAGPQPRVSLVRYYGRDVLWLPAIPFLISIAVGGLVRLRIATQWRWPGVMAWALAGATVLAALAGFATIIIGVYILPMGVLLCLSASAASSESSASRPTA